MSTQPRPRHWPPPKPARRDTPPAPPAGALALEQLKSEAGEGLENRKFGLPDGEFVSGGAPATGRLEPIQIPAPPWKGKPC